MTVKKMLGRVEYKEILAGNTWIIGIRLPEVIDFIPGQFVSLRVNDDNLRRAYSVASLPGKKTIDLVIDITPMGIGSKYVLGLSVGDEVDVLGVLGKFVVGSSALDSKEIVFLGTGTGIVPLKPMIENLLVQKKFRGQVYLTWGMRYEKDLYWMKEIDKLQRDFDNFHFEVALSRPSEDWPGMKGHVGDVIEKMNCDWINTSAYLCGNMEMILEMKNVFISKGVPEEKINYERFA